MSRHSEMSLDERIGEFHRGYDYENDAAVTLIELVRAAGDFLEKITGEESVNAGMKKIIGDLGSGKNTTWREDLENGDGSAYLITVLSSQTIFW